MPRVKTFDEQEVLEKAMTLFWKQGFHATSMQNLVDHLGINRASIYDTFGDKKTLYMRALQLYRCQNRTSILEFFAQQDSVQEGMKKLMALAAQEAVQDKEQRGCFVVNCTIELVPGDRTVFLEVLDNKKTFIDIFVAFFQKGVERGEISPDKDIHALASFFFTFYNGLRVMSKIDPDPGEYQRMIKMALAVLE